MNPPKAPLLSYKDIGKITLDFLNEHHPSLIPPIPIEEIAERNLNLTIIPSMGMKENYDVDGCLSSDLSAIFIDYNIYMKYENRSRFTIAHELGHLILHSNIFSGLEIKDANDIYKISEQIDDRQYGWLEWQAYSFAGQVLVPKQSLENEISKKLGRIPGKHEPEILFPTIQDLLDTFNVSGEVMLRRLQKEGIVKSDH